MICFAELPAWLSLSILIWMTAWPWPRTMGWRLKFALHRAATYGLTAVAGALAKAAGVDLGAVNAGVYGGLGVGRLGVCCVCLCMRACMGRGRVCVRGRVCCLLWWCVVVCGGVHGEVAVVCAVSWVLTN